MFCVLSPLIAALGRYWGLVELVASPIGHAGATLNKTLYHLTATFSTVRPHVDQARASKGAIDTATDHNARIHVYNLFKSIMDSLADLA